MTNSGNNKLLAIAGSVALGFAAAQPAHAVVAVGGAPEVVVALGFEQRRDPSSRFLEVRDFDEDVDDGLGSEARDSSATKVFDPLDEFAR